MTRKEEDALWSRIKQLENHIQVLARAGTELSQLQSLNQGIIDRLVRLAIYYKDAHDSPADQTIESYSEEAVSAYIQRVSKTFAQRMSNRSKKAGTVGGDHGVGGTSIYRSEALGADVISDEVNG